jgi:hypothetical protein
MGIYTCGMCGCMPLAQPPRCGTSSRPFTRNMLAPTESIKVLLSLDAPTPIGASADKETGSAEVAFPALNAKDVTGGSPEIVCTGRFKEGKLAYKPDATAVFPEGATEVTCIAYMGDEKSPAVTFTVTVCAPDMFFVNGACTGEARKGGGCRRLIPYHGRRL